MPEKSQLNNALIALKSERMRITEPRKALLETLISIRHPISAEQLHQALGKETSDLVTVYRNLEVFEKAGIVQRLMTESGKSLYELIEASHHHHHILCRKCHRAERLDACEAQKLEKLAEDLGYSEVTHVLELYGVCEACRES